jgi:peptide-methionine (S)-S-oxide reductase
MTVTPECAYFAAGCFWGIEKKFAAVRGVVHTEVGYMGGELAQPTYELVCSGSSGHAETVKVEFDPAQISYTELLQHFWRMHNPTCLNYQGWDVGTQYRSAIFYVDDHQRQQAEQSRTALNDARLYPTAVVTEISPATRFWRAEEYHQQYLMK